MEMNGMEAIIQFTKEAHKVVIVCHYRRHVPEAENVHALFLVDAIVPRQRREREREPQERLHERRVQVLCEIRCRVVPQLREQLADTPSSGPSRRALLIRGGPAWAHHCSSGTVSVSALVPCADAVEESTMRTAEMTGWNIGVVGSRIAKRGGSVGVTSLAIGCSIEEQRERGSGMETHLAGRFGTDASEHFSTECSWLSLVGSNGDARDEACHKRHGILQALEHLKSRWPKLRDKLTKGHDVYAPFRR